MTAARYFTVDYFYLTGLIWSITNAVTYKYSFPARWRLVTRSVLHQSEPHDWYVGNQGTHVMIAVKVQESNVLNLLRWIRYHCRRYNDDVSHNLGYVMSPIRSCCVRRCK